MRSAVLQKKSIISCFFISFYFILMSGCGGSATPSTDLSPTPPATSTPSATPIPSATPTPSASPSPSPSPIPEIVWNLVKDKGIDPNNSKPGVDAVVLEAKAYLQANPTKKLVLFFPAEIYKFFHSTQAAIEFSDIKSGKLTFRGAGQDKTKLVFMQFDQRGFDFEASNNITIEEMELTRPTLYVSQGDVTEVTPGHVKFKVHSGFPNPVDLMNAPNAQDNERTLLRFRGNPLDPELAPNSEKIKLKDMVELGNGLFDAILKDSSELADLNVGDQVAVKAKVGDKTIFAKDTKDFTMRNITISNRSAVPIAVDASDRTVIQRLTLPRAAPINGRTPFFSGPAGGPQIEAKTFGPLIEYCNIVGTTDDAIALFSSDMNALSSGAIVRNNIIRDSQGRGINITQSKNGIVAKNTIERSVNASIQLRLTAQANATNAAVINWTIENNALIEGWSDAVIWINKENASDNASLHDNIFIKNNLFILAPKNNPMIHIDNADKVLINNNVIVSFSSENDVPVEGVPQPAPLLYVEGGLDISGTGNTYEQTINRITTIVEPGSFANVEWSLSLP